MGSNTRVTNLKKKLPRKNDKCLRNFFDNDRKLEYNKHTCIQQTPSFNYHIISYTIKKEKLIAIDF